MNEPSHEPNRSETPGQAGTDGDASDREMSKLADDEWPDLDETQDAAAHALGDSSTPLVIGKLVDQTDAGDAEGIRVGSPFAVDPLGPFADATRPIEAVIDGGPLRYTAIGAVGAAGMVLMFAAVAAWWFPAGGTMIASLGCILSIFGLYSSYRYTSIGMLGLHLALFIVSYGRTLS